MRLFKVYAVKKNDAESLRTNPCLNQFDMKEIKFLPTFLSYDKAVMYLKGMGTLYYTYYTVNGKETFLYYIPTMGKSKYIIKEEEGFIQM